MAYPRKDDKDKHVSIAGTVLKPTYAIMSEEAQARRIRISEMVRLVIEGWIQGRMPERLIEKVVTVKDERQEELPL